MYHPDLPHVVYGKDVWWTDQWTHTAFARDPDWSRPFFDQFNDLFQTTPLLALSVLLLENSDFNNCAGNLKNCYLCFDVDYLEECYYLGNSIHCEHCFDCDMIQQSQFCYDCFNCAESRNLIHCVDCRTSHDLIFCQGCTGCSDCLFCFNQYRKTHCIYNEQYSPDEYEKKKKEIIQETKEKEKY